jgi:Tol biopolymer transport system component
MAENESGQDKLLVSNMDGTAKKELATLPALVGLAWSKADSWIAFSGGEKSNYDIWVVKSNGTAKEQLTNGLFSTDKLFWSDNGNKVAFTSNKEFELADLTGIKPSSEAISDFSLPVDNSTAYILTLNIQDSKKSSITHQASSSRTELSQHILNILRRETELNLK